MRKHILIVDDEELFREICQDMLVERGYRVSVAEDVPTALAVLQSDQVDLLVVDITLPGTDGLTMIEQVQDNHPDLPSIVITGFLTPENMLRSLNLGVKGFLTKPFFYDELFQAVEKTLERSAARRNQLFSEHYLPLIHLGQEILTTRHGELFSHTLGSALRIALLQTEATQGFIAVRENSAEQLSLAASLGFKPEEQPGLQFSLRQLHTAITDNHMDVENLDLLAGMRCLVAPVPSGDDTVGAFVLARPKSDGDFSEEARQLTHLLAIQTAIAVHHEQSHRRTHHNADELARTLNDLSAALIPSGAGPATGEQRAELAQIASAVAESVGCDKATCRSVADATLFHDIGKAFLPERLLCKPSSLTEVEQNQMRTYVDLGAYRLARIPTLRRAAPFVASQRERWDGSGYPRGISRDQIPLGAQVVGIISCWSALRNDRPYRSALSEDNAIQALCGLVDRDFSRQVVDALLTELGATELADEANQ